MATYRRDNDAVTITPPGGEPTRHSCSRSSDSATLTLDGRAFRRTDWDLTGRHLDGTWQSGAELLTLAADGSVSRGARSGRYTLGVGSLSIAWADGATEQLTLLWDLKPSSRRPSALWLGDRWWSLKRD